MFQGYAFIIGAMKAGTTTLHALLSQHPAIAVPKKKEPNFFQGAGQTTPEEYEAIFPGLDKSRHAWTLDSSTNYSKAAHFPDAPRRIAALPGGKRIVYIMRDPVDRIESHIAHNVARGRWSKFNGLDTLAPHNLAALEGASDYARQIDAYRNAGLGDILLLDFDRLCIDPCNVAAETLSFLNLDHSGLSSIPPQNVRRTEKRFLTCADVEMWREKLRPRISELASLGFEADWLHRYI